MQMLLINYENTGIVDNEMTRGQREGLTAVQVDDERQQGGQASWRGQLQTSLMIPTFPIRTTCITFLGTNVCGLLTSFLYVAGTKVDMSRTTHGVNTHQPHNLKGFLKR